jgi:hypothetical protein
MEAALIFPAVVLIIAALAVAYGRWGAGKSRREAANAERPRWYGPGTGAGGTGLGGMDGGGL